MKDFLRKLRELDKWMEAVWEDPNFVKVLAEDEEGERDRKAFQEMSGRIYQMRASAKMQDMEMERAKATEELAGA